MKIKYWPHSGELVCTSSDGCYQSDAQKEARRGTIRGFSRKSKSRLRRYLDAAEPTIFVTLTYRADSPPTHRQRVRELGRFWKIVLESTTDEIYAVWVLEYTKKGTPHYHLLICGTPFIDKELISIAWYRSAGEKTSIESGTNTKKVPRCSNSYQNDPIRRYLNKYFSKNAQKLAENASHKGRFWGLLNWPDGLGEPLEAAIGSKAAQNRISDTTKHAKNTFFCGDSVYFRLEEQEKWLRETLLNDFKRFAKT